jgi:hypothetical protein
VVVRLCVLVVWYFVPPSLHQPPTSNLHHHVASLTRCRCCHCIAARCFVLYVPPRATECYLVIVTTATAPHLQPHKQRHNQIGMASGQTTGAMANRRCCALTTNEESSVVFGPRPECFTASCPELINSPPLALGMRPELDLVTREPLSGLSTRPPTPSRALQSVSMALVVCCNNTTIQSLCSKSDAKQSEQ